MINETADFVNITTGSYGHEKGKPFITTNINISDLAELIENSKTISDRNVNKQSLHNIIDKTKEYHFYIDLDRKTGLEFNNICSHIFKYFKQIREDLTLDDLKYTKNKGKEFSYHLEIPKIYATPPVIRSHIEEIAIINSWEHGTYDKGVYGGKDKYRLPYQPKPSNKEDKYNPNSMHEIVNGEAIDFILAYIPEGATKLPQPISETPIPKLPETKEEKKIFGKDDTIRKLLKCISPERSKNYLDWIKIMYIIKNELGPEGENVFIEFCNRDSNYVHKENENRYSYKNAVINKEHKQATIGSLIYMAREDNPEMFNEVQKKLVFMKSYRDGAEKFYEMNKDIMVFAGEYGIFAKHKNIWTRVYHNSPELLNLIITFRFFKIVDDKYIPDLTDYDKIEKFAKMLCLYIRNYVDDTFYNKLHTSMIGKVAFNDGIYCVEDRKFYKYGDEKLRYVYPNRKVCYNYEGYTPSDAKIQEVENGIFKAIFGDDYIRAINFIGRATFGYYKDKDWGKFIGNRNCGKGVLCQYLQHTLQSYVGTISGDKLLYERQSTKEKDTKENAWLIDFEFKRFMLINEFKFCATNKNIKVDGVKLKGLASGGDMWRGRKNFRDDVEFFIEAKPIIFANDIPPIEPIDTMQTCISFNTTRQFISQSLYDEYKQNINSEFQLQKFNNYSVEDTEIKNKISTDDYIYSFWKILEKYFDNKKLKSNEILLEDDDGGVNLDKYIEDKFIITKNHKDMITLKCLRDDIKEGGFNFSPLKCKNELIITHKVKEIHRVDGKYLTGLKFKDVVNENVDYDEDNEI